MVLNVTPAIFLLLLTRSGLCLDQTTPVGHASGTLDDDSASTTDANTMDTILHASKMLLNSLSSSGAGSMGNWSADTAGPLLKQRVDSGAISANCADHVDILIQALDTKEQWAMRMIDAIGKPPSGLFEAKLTWLGDWEECIKTEATANDSNALQSRPFTGQYCSVSIPLSFGQFAGRGASVSIGICVPNSCNADDTKQLIDLGLSFLPENFTIPATRVTCKETTLSLDSRAIAAIVICSLFLAVMVIATLYDVVYLHWLVNTRNNLKSVGKLENGSYAKTDLTRQEGNEKGVNSETSTSPAAAAGNNVPDVVDVPGGPSLRKQGSSIGTRLLLSFSVFTNGSKLLTTRQGQGSLTAVHGIRFISMTWVMVGHGFSALKIPVIENGLVYGADITKRHEFAAVLNGYFAVDTFFVLSGLLVSYLSLKEMKKLGGAKTFKWGMFYFHRFWRLTPPYMMALMLYVCILRNVANGPLWRQEGHADKDCVDGWWKNLLYVNNLVKGEEQPLGCMQWTWYLANDMQFYIISPLMLVPLFYSPLLGGISCLVFLAVSVISSGVISMDYDLPPAQLYDRATAKVFTWNYYVKPWCRIGPYAVGVFTGYLLYRYKQDVKINKIAILLGWITAFSLGCLIIYGLFSADMTNPMSMSVSALFNATARTVWGACVAWVIFACAIGCGGPINHFLSWSGFVPLSRLTYFAYLTHPIVMEVYIFSQLQTIYVYDYSMVYMMLGHVCMSYAVSFVLSLAFEAPMMGIEKALLGRTKRS